VKAFKKWVHKEVLPSIRKHGIYATDSVIEAMIADPTFAIKTFSALHEAREAKKLAEQKRMVAEAERNEAIRTKAQISDKKTATALVTAKIACDRADKLACELGMGTKYASIKNMMKTIGGEYDPYALKKASGGNIQKVSDMNYGTVNAYPAEAWMEVYQIDLSKVFPRK